MKRLNLIRPFPLGIYPANGELYLVAEAFYRLWELTKYRE